MRAIRIHEFGGPEVLKLEETQRPEPAEGQLLVRVYAAGVNPADTYVRSGNYPIKPELPFTPGTDGAGTVEMIGRGVSKYKPGDRVYIGRSVTGTYAEFALTLETQVHRLPEAVSYAQGAGVYVPYATAYYALHDRAKARGGETLLVHGASGGVGIAAVQMGRAMGMTVLGTAGSPEGFELVMREGAHHAFDHTKHGYQEAILAATGGRGVDVVLEMLANVNLAGDMKLIARDGRIVIIGSRGDVTVTPRELMSRRGSVLAFTLWGVTESEAAEIDPALAAGLENGTLRPVVGSELPLSDAAAAHRQVMAQRAYGKIVLIP
ncbi:MAG: NADPH:quinone reductase [Spirochaetes bacterium]|nr:NADPH:quinone reductase [Spirochaetota bacterium]